MSERRQQSVGDAVIDILKCNTQVLPATDLFVLATRALRDHGVAREKGASMPPALHSLNTFTDYLRTAMASKLHLSGRNNDCEVHLKRAAPEGESGPSQEWERGTPIAPHGARPITESPEPSASSSHHWYGDLEGGGVASDAFAGAQGAQTYPLPTERLAEVRQRVCDVLVTHVLHESSAHSVATSLALPDLLRRCTQYLIQGFHNMPRELMYEEALEGFIHTSGCAALVHTPGQPTQAFRPLNNMPTPPRTPSPQPLQHAALHLSSSRAHSLAPPDTPIWPSPAAPHTMPPPSIAPPMQPMYSPLSQISALPLPTARPDQTRGRFLDQHLRSAQHVPSPPPYMQSPAPRNSIVGPPPMHHMPHHMSPPPAPTPPFMSRGAPGAAHLEAAVVALLRSRNAFDGPKSQAVEAVRVQLLQTPEVAGNTALASLAAFQGFLLHLPSVQVWTSKTSDVVRCLLKREAVPAAQWPHMRDSMPPPALTAYSSPEDIEAFAVMSGLPTLYKAVHVFLASRKVPSTDLKTAVPVHALLRALRSPRCAGAQWASHPGLRSAPILLRFLKDDTALAIGDNIGEKLDTTPLHLNKYHNSYRAAIKAFDGTVQNTASLEDSVRCTPMHTPSITPSHTPSRSPSASSPAADNRPYDTCYTHTGHGGALISPTFVSTGYPSIREAVQLWGPTGNTHALNQFFDVHGNSRCWGLDYKLAPPHHTLSFAVDGDAARSVGGRVVLLTVACCDACLVWDISAGGVPQRLQQFLEDADVQKCQVSSGALVSSLLRTFCIASAGVIDLRQLQMEAYPDQPEVAAGKLSGIVQSVLGVRVPPHAAMDQSDWSARPLSPAQTHHTLQCAWLHAHLMQRLGAAVGWKSNSLQRCIVST